MEWSPFLRDEAIRIIVTWLITFLFLIFVIFQQKPLEQFSRVVLDCSWLFVTPTLLIASVTAYVRYAQNVFINRTIAIAGITEQAVQFADSIENNLVRQAKLQVFMSLAYKPRRSNCPATMPV